MARDAAVLKPITSRIDGQLATPFSFSKTRVICPPSPPVLQPHVISDIFALHAIGIPDAKGEEGRNSERLAWDAVMRVCKSERVANGVGWPPRTVQVPIKLFQVVFTPRFHFRD
jgi:hypothetical protein